MYADSEDPSKIKEIEEAGYNVIPATKGKGSVVAGIDQIKGRKLYVTKSSAKGLKELQTYSWKVKGDLILDDPVKIRDDFCDSLRYAVHSFLSDDDDDVGMFIA